MSDLISRQAAIDVMFNFHECYGRRYAEIDLEEFDALPSAQPEPAIPISWLEKEVEHLESRKNSFAVLDAMRLKALIKRWRGEQDDTE